MSRGPRKIIMTHYTIPDPNTAIVILTVASVPIRGRRDYHAKGGQVAGEL